MNLEIFKSQCEKLLSRFGDENLDKEFLNAVWLEVKSLDDEHIVKVVTNLIKTKPLHGEAFSIDDFTNVDKPVEKPKLKKSGAMPKYKANSVNYDEYGLENYLSSRGVKSITEAMEYEKKKGGT